MTTIDPRSAVLAALQARRPLSRFPLGARRAARGQGTSQAEQAGLTLRLAAIDRADPDRRRKAVRIVLEVELARAFGSALLNDPDLPQMLDAVQEQMHGDAQAAAAVHALGDLLLQSP